MTLTEMSQQRALVVAEIAARILDIRKDPTLKEVAMAVMFARVIVGEAFRQEQETTYQTTMAEMVANVDSRTE